MSAEVQAEYDAALTRLTLRHGMVVSRYPGISWMDAGATKHLHQCRVTFSRTAIEDHWNEFGDTFNGQRTMAGFTVTDVECDCGLLQGRTLRWQVDLSEATAAVFAEGFRQD